MIPLLHFPVQASGDLAEQCLESTECRPGLVCRSFECVEEQNISKIQIESVKKNVLQNKKAFEFLAKLSTTK